MRGDEINRGTRQRSLRLKTSLEAAKRPANAPKANHNAARNDGLHRGNDRSTGKQRREISHLITTRSDIPRLAINFTCESTGQFWIAVNNGDPDETLAYGP